MFGDGDDEGDFGFDGFEDGRGGVEGWDQDRGGLGFGREGSESVTEGREYGKVGKRWIGVRRRRRDGWGNTANDVGAVGLSRNGVGCGLEGLVRLVLMV